MASIRSPRGAGTLLDQEDSTATNLRIKELAGVHRLRCYRDPCGGYNIPGKYGEIFCYGPGRLGVQVGGPRANQTATAISSRGANQLIARLRRAGRWRVSQGGDGEAVSVGAVEDLALAARTILAYRKRPPSVPPPPEVAARGLEALRSRRHPVQGALAERGEADTANEGGGSHPVAAPATGPLQAPSRATSPGPLDLFQELQGLARLLHLTPPRWWH